MPRPIIGRRKARKYPIKIAAFYYIISSIRYMFQKRTESFLFSTLKNHFINYPTPFNLSYLWNFGSLAGFCLMLQITTGFFLSVHYTADVATSFNSVEHIMRDVNLG